MSSAAQRGAALLQHYLRRGERTALDLAVTLLRQGLGETPRGGREHTSCRSNLLAALTLRWSATGDPRDLGGLVVLGRTTAAGSPSLQDLLLFGQALTESHDRTGTPGQLDEAIEVFGRAATLPDPDGRLMTVLNSRAVALLARFHRTGRLSDLATAEADLRRALALPDAGPGVRPLVLGNLANVRFLRHRADDGPTALTEAVGLYREAIAGLPAGSPERPAMLRHLGEALASAADARVPGAALQGILVCRQGLALAPAGHPEHGSLLSCLGVLLRLAVEGGELGVDALGEAAMVLRKAVGSTPADHPDRPERLMRLGNVLHRHSLLAREPGLLDEAIDCLRQAVAGFAGLPSQHDHRDGARVNLAAALHRRHLVTGDLASLRESAAVIRELMGSATRLARDSNGLSNASAVFQTLAAADPEAGDAAREAVETARAALRRAPDRAVVRADRLNTLANALTVRARPGDPGPDAHADLDEAVTLLEQAADLLPPDSPDFAGTLRDLGATWLRKAELIGDRAAAEQAIIALGRAVIAGEPWPGRRAQHEFHHADALRLLYDWEGDPGVLRTAAHGYRQAALTVQAPPLERAAAARAWGDAAVECESATAALEAYRLAVDLLPQVAPRHLARADQQQTLARLSGLAARAAACAVDTGDVRLAVRLLEQGRGTLLGHLLEARGEMTELRAAHPQAAARLTDLRDRMDDLSLGPDEAPGTSDERHTLGARWEEELRRVRRLPGFASFLALPSLDELMACADQGPVVLLYGGPRRGDALILTGPGAPVRHLALPALGEAAVSRQAARFRDALTASRSPGEEQDANRVLHEVLAWLWDNAVGPVLDALAPPSAPPQRLWWSPSGALSALPLHAAGHHGDPTRTALDRVVSSYTPALRALRHARARERRPVATPDSLLAVVQSEAVGNRHPLRGAEREAKAIGTLLPTCELAGPEATFDAVYAALPQHPYAHFACHGVSDLADPSAGELLLHDHAERPLTVRDISRLDLSAARLAVLSACETSRTAGPLADEAIHITSAFQVAGYPHVVGTLWPVHDAVARRVATGFYRELRAGPRLPGTPALDTGRAAVALHRAVRACRARYERSPSLWAAHVHAGA
ncbi:CHAT domain-containing tetratricopeptide repeat protein [Streptomyces lomondensis]|uniref:CHAT domain-containing tetratricopeptide repeat protein n=1 Tax=Streptomyces lomondensis TaxID=68229 RepID=UPI001672801F|nr:CHAT domain-containing protein [Streptomyces lomondensis]MCF0080445.1 CHAT domain-containing protein [Streptomyces lomondensis]